MEHLIHLLIPRESNNHKAKVLHPSGLLTIAAFLFLFQLSLNFLPKVSPSVLGYASSISKDEVVRLTNQKRAEAGLSQLSLNVVLSNAAQSKGSDMISKDYWAHVAPDGTQPWAFFNGVGYKYRYAGENLARDFTNATEAVNAWMNSPTHRENILNPKYKEIGIGVVEGDLAGSDTTIIVQFFGATYADKVVKPLAEASTTEQKNPVEEVKLKTIESPKPVDVAPTIPPQVLALPQQTSVIKPIETNVASASSQVLVSPFTTTKSVSLVVVAILLLIFMVDAFLVSKRRITRIAGRTFAHVIFLAMVLSIVVILKSGRIM